MRHRHPAAWIAGYVALTSELPSGAELRHGDRTRGSGVQQQTEEIFEAVRRARFADRPSRRTCIYAAHTLEAARAWHRNRPFIYSVEMSGNIFAANSELWTLAIERAGDLSRVAAIADEYWQGLRGHALLVELLVDGRVRIIELVEHRE